jgi:hypothetical protein
MKINQDYKKDIRNLNNAFKSLNMTSASVKLAGILKTSSYENLSGEHNEYQLWTSVIDECMKPAPSTIQTAAETYLRPGSDAMANAPDPESLNEDEIRESIAIVEESDIDLENISTACINYMKMDRRLYKTANLKQAVPWKRTMELAARAALEEVERVAPNSFSKEDIKLASIQAGVLFTKDRIEKTGSWASPIRWIGNKIKGAFGLLKRALGRLLPVIGVVAAIYFGYEAWKKWRQEINFIFTDLDAGSYGITNMDTWFVSGLSGKIEAGLESKMDVTLSPAEIPNCAGDSECGWRYTEETPEEVSFSEMVEDMGEIFTGGDEIIRPEFIEGGPKPFRETTGSPSEFISLAALNISCEAIMANAYYLLENIIMGIVSFWALVVEIIAVMGAVTAPIAGIAASIDAVVSFASMQQGWAARKRQKAGFTNNRNFIFGVAGENQQRINSLVYGYSVEEAEEISRNQVASVSTTPDINIVPTALRGGAALLKAVASSG